MIITLLYQGLAYDICYTWKNIKNSYKDIKFKISALTWNEEFELPDMLYSVADTQDYFENILKHMEKNWQSCNKNIHKQNRK